MSVVLYTHQLDAIKKLINGSILVGGVGTGKSRTSLGYFYKENGGGFTPVTGSVENEEKIIGYDLSKPMNKKPLDLYIITTARKRDSMEWEGELSVYFMSVKEESNRYKNKVVIDSWNNITKYLDIRDAFFIFDEQKVVGSGSWSKTFIKIARRNKWILLSATPGDTWSDYAPVFIANGFYKNFSHFRTQHCVYSRFSKYPKIDHYVEVGTLEKYRSKILVYMNFDRPTIPHHEIVKVEYDKDIYDDVLKRKWNIYLDKPCKEIAELCSVLRRVVNSDPSREDEVLAVYNKHKKVIIFYNYDYELEILRNLAENNGIECAEWNGHKHEELPLTNSWIYLVQYMSGAEAWNCIVTDCILFYSQTYSYKCMTQAAGRIDRLNTSFKDLWYYHLVSSSKIDVAINRCLKNKKNFNEKSFCSDGGIIL